MVSTSSATVPRYGYNHSRSSKNHGVARCGSHGVPKMTGGSGYPWVHCTPKSLMPSDDFGAGRQPNGHGHTMTQINCFAAWSRWVHIPKTHDSLASCPLTQTNLILWDLGMLPSLISLNSCLFIQSSWLCLGWLRPPKKYRINHLSTGTEIPLSTLL